MRVAVVDHVCGDDCADGCESSLLNLADCRPDGDGASRDHCNRKKSILLEILLSVDKVERCRKRIKSRKLCYPRKV